MFGRINKEREGASEPTQAFLGTDQAATSGMEKLSQCESAKNCGSQMPIHDNCMEELSYNSPIKIILRLKVILIKGGTS